MLTPKKSATSAEVAPRRHSLRACTLYSGIYNDGEPPLLPKARTSRTSGGRTGLARWRYLRFVVFGCAAMVHLCAGLFWDRHDGLISSRFALSIDCRNGMP